ncbi:MAG: glycosyltransferase family 39 protein [Terrimicrobiaceae bacterium]|nr:glycosyltransferase family 39 protein [Terrimicrobiaceae bacterium]
MKWGSFAGLAGGRAVIVVPFLAIAAFFLFASLGSYALWDDEAVGALTAKAVLRDGDTGAMLDHNIIAYRDGLLVRDGADRSTPPLPTYLKAVSFAGLGVSAWAARLPFALAGFALAMLLAFWSCRMPRPAQVVFLLALIGNVSLWLFCRQARYYGLSVLLSTVVVFLYTRWLADRRDRWLWSITASSALLFATHYLAAVALYACLFADFLIFQRKSVRWTLRELAIVFIPQTLSGLFFLSIWNPFQTAFGGYVQKNGPLDRLTLLWWNLRDLNSAEFLVGPLILMAVYCAIRHRDRLAGRQLCALAVYVVVISALSPQTVFNTNVADIRYLVPVIPLAAAIGAWTLHLLIRRRRLLVATALLVFWTNVLNGGWFFPWGVRSTVLEFVTELLRPPPEPYSAAIQWIRQNVPEKASVVVLPSHMVYPLMFHAPAATYGWQLHGKDPGKFPPLPEIHYAGREWPDYFVAFGPSVSGLANWISNQDQKAHDYQIAAQIPVFWKDLYRPELFWRSFREVRPQEGTLDGIYIFGRTASTPPLKP